MEINLLLANIIKSLHEISLFYVLLMPTYVDIILLRDCKTLLWRNSAKIHEMDFIVFLLSLEPSLGILLTFSFRKFYYFNHA